MPGFRPGKAPRRLLEARLGTEIARDQALRDSLPEYYVDAVVAETTSTSIAPPEIDITAGEEEGDVEFDAVVEVRPQCHARGLRRAARRDRQARRRRRGRRRARSTTLRDRFADLADSDDAAHRRRLRRDRHHGLRSTTSRSRASPPPTSSTRSARASSCPSSTSSCTASAPATSSSSTTTLPERFGERAGEEVAFQVLVKDAKKKVLPELTDEWVAEVERVRHRRRAARRRPQAPRDVRAACRRRWPCATRCFEAAADLVPDRRPRDARRQRDGASPRTTSRTGSRSRVCA